MFLSIAPLRFPGQLANTASLLIEKVEVPMHYIHHVYLLNKSVNKDLQTNTACPRKYANIKFEGCNCMMNKAPTLSGDIRSMLTTQNPEPRIHREEFCIFWAIIRLFMPNRREFDQSISALFALSYILFSLFYHKVTRVRNFFYKDLIIM